MASFVFEQGTLDSLALARDALDRCELAYNDCRLDETVAAIEEAMKELKAAKAIATKHSAMS